MAQNGSNVDSRYKARHKGKHVATIGAFNWEPMQSGMITIFLLKLLGLKGSSMCLGINRRKVRNYACLREDELQKVFNLSDISENSVPIQFLDGHHKITHFPCAWFFHNCGLLLIDAKQLPDILKKPYSGLPDHNPGIKGNFFIIRHAFLS